MHRLNKEYLLQFRRCQHIGTLEEMYEGMKGNVNEGECQAFVSAYGHRKTEISAGILFDAPLEEYGDLLLFLLHNATC